MQTSGAEQALAEVERLGRIVEGLLSLARADAGASRTERVELDAVIAERVALCDRSRGRGRARAGACGARPTGSARSSTTWSRTRLAVSGRRDRLGTRRVGDWVELHVVDEGPACPRRIVARAFDRFWRGRSAAPGSGLGPLDRPPPRHGRRRRGRVARGGGGGIDAVVRLRPCLSPPDRFLYSVRVARPTAFASVDRPAVWPRVRGEPRPERLDAPLDSLTGVGPKIAGGCASSASRRSATCWSTGRATTSARSARAGSSTCSASRRR